MEAARLKALHEAISRNAAAVISLPSAGMLRHHKTRFLGEGEGGFYVESVPEEGRLIEQLMLLKKPVGVAYKTSVLKTVFTAPVLRREPAYAVNAETQVEALLLAFPDQVKTVQRRSAYRVRVPASTELSVQVWRIAEHAVLRDRPTASLEMPVQVADLSITGAGLLFKPMDGTPPRLVSEQRLRIVVRYQGLEVLAEGRVRHLRLTPDKSLRAGVQFQKLEDNLDGRQAGSKLAMIVALMHRDEVRRIRTGA